MIYDLYFHNDFDGHASAALLLAFFEGRGDAVGHFVPVDHDLQAQWLREGFFKEHHLFAGKRNRPVVVDFPFHPGTAFWFDHHPTAFKKEAWRKRFHADNEHAYNPRYLSCCHFVYETLKRNFNWQPPEHLKALVPWLDVIDGATYASARQTILIKEPALMIDAYLDAQKRSAKKSAWFIRLLAQKSLSDIARVSEIMAAGKRARKQAIGSLAFYRKHIVTRGNVTVIDLTHDGEKFLRYAAYDLFPKVNYAMRIRKKGPLYSIGVGANPWLKRKGGVHLGELVKKYGGGGHKDAGAVEFKTRIEAVRVVEEIVKILNEKTNGRKKK